MRDPRIVGRFSSPGPSLDRRAPLVSHKQSISLTNSAELDPDQPIPYVLTELGHREARALQADGAAAKDCRHPHRKYDAVDQLLYCDDCGKVWEIDWKDGYPVERKRP